MRCEEEHDCIVAIRQILAILADYTRSPTCTFEIVCQGSGLLSVRLCVNLASPCSA